ncbi:DNA polymerase III subunit delta [bacterium]|jgi:DNA polymerase III subunit delta|nr:DNA polymerase III subunit delta [bacterium]MBT4649077.1 DNA polymerase III subunit delta [bacterium]
MIFFFYGEDSFRAKNKIDAIKAKFQTTVDQGGHNIESLDGDTMAIDDFFRSVTATGFLAPKKLIVIKNIFDNKKLASFQDELIKYLAKQSDSPEENYLIFWQASKPDLRKKLYKTLKKFKYTEEFNALSPDKINAWINKKCQANNKTIQPIARQLLLASVGNNLWQLDQEINKLIHFSQNPEIIIDEVKELVQAKADDNIFNFIDALGKKDKARALKLLEDQLNSGVNGLYILTMITSQFRTLIKVKILSEKINNSFAISQTLKIHTFVASKTLAMSKLYTLAELKKIYQQLLTIDAKLKTGQGKERLLFAQMIEKL